MGTPTKFSPSVSERMLLLYEQGKTDQQVADIFGITVRTIHNWKLKYPDFFHAIREAKEGVDSLVEAALLNRALGYSYTEEKVFCSFGRIITYKSKVHLPPDVKAAQFWLQNRQPDKWKNRLEVSPPPQPLNVIQTKSFTQFCLDAGYPEPFEKQVEMMEFAMNLTDPRMIRGSRGYGKTDYVSILGIAYDIYLNGVASTNLIITKSKTRNASLVQEIAKALIANGVQLEKENSTCIRIQGMVGKDHSVEALTIKSSMRGRHPKRVLMDDPVTDEDTSEAMRKLVKRRYDEVMKLCQDIIILGQPAHKLDLYAELLDKVRVMDVPYGTIPELDPDLDAQRLAGVDEASIQASYYLKIVSEGQTPFEAVKYLDLFPMRESSVAFIDPSFEGGDYTALSIVTAHMQGVAVVGFMWKKSWNHSLDDIAPKLLQYNVKRLCFETNSLGDQPIDILRQVFGGGVGIIGKKSNTNKHSRIMSAGQFAHMIHISKESDKNYINQVVQYEYNAKNDDAPDSLASCLEWIGLIRGKK